MPASDLNDAHEREIVFHDALAFELRPETMPVPQPDHLEARLLELLGDVTALEILDVGCGTGDLSLMLARRGARVTGVDLSPGMISVATERARQHLPDAGVTFMAGPVESMNLTGGRFDAVVGKWILHHVPLDSGLDEVVRVLKPGGRGLFIENALLNPILRFARERLTGRFGIIRLGTEDEHPFLAADFSALRARFPGLEVVFPDFVFFRLFDRQILKFRYHGATHMLGRADDGIYKRFPRLRRYSFHVIVGFERTP